MVLRCRTAAARDVAACGVGTVDVHEDRQRATVGVRQVSDNRSIVGPEAAGEPMPRWRMMQGVEVSDDSTHVRGSNQRSANEVSGRIVTVVEVPAQTDGHRPGWRELEFCRLPPDMTGSLRSTTCAATRNHGRRGESSATSEPERDRTKHGQQRARPPISRYCSHRDEHRNAGVTSKMSSCSEHHPATVPQGRNPPASERPFAVAPARRDGSQNPSGFGGRRVGRRCR